MSDKPDLASLRIDRNRADDETRSRPWWLVVLIVVALAAVGAYWKLRPGAVEVRTASVLATGGGAGYGSGISANGYVVARTRASVSAKITGRLTAIKVSEGSVVKEGDVMAIIEDNEYAAGLGAAKAAVGQAEAQWELARQTLARAKELRALDHISQAELDQAVSTERVAEAQVQSAKANVRLAAAGLENTRIRAPFDGTVLRKDAEVGELVSPMSAGSSFTRTAIVTMADLGTLEVETDVNEAYIARIQNDQAARITLDAYPNADFAARVRQVVPTADRQKATVLVKVAILDKDPRILPEMAAKVVFIDDEPGQEATAEPRRVTAPAGAIVGTGGDAYVWLIEGEKASRRAVKTGERLGSEIEIKSGLTGGEKVVIEPPPGLDEGQTVTVKAL